MLLGTVDVADSDWAARLFQKRERVREKENEQKKCMQLKLKSLQWGFAVELCVYSAKKKRHNKGKAVNTEAQSDICLTANVLRTSSVTTR